MADELHPEDEGLFQPPEELNKTSSGASNRTEIMRPTVDSFDERLERVRSRQYTSQSMPPVRKRRRSWIVSLVAMVVLALTCALVVLSLFLPPFAKDNPIADALESEDAFIALNSEDTYAEQDNFRVEVHPGDPGVDFAVALNRVSAQDYRDGNVPSENWSCPAMETLPEFFTETGGVYSIDSQGTAPIRVGLKIPEEEHDLYGWYAGAWIFLPSQLAAEGQARVTDVPVLPECIVAGTVKDAVPDLSVNLDLGQTRSEAITMNRLFIRGMQPTVQGNLQGVLPADTPTNPGYPVIPLVSNYTAPEVIDAVTVEAILRSPEMRLQHSAHIAGFAEANNYPAVALDYREIPPELRNQFSDLVKNVSRMLKSQGRALIVVVPSAVFEEGWQTGAYDWRTLGLLVDELIVRLPLNPDAYLPNGEVDAMLRWAVGEVSRTKLSLAVSALSIQTAPGSPSRLVGMKTMSEEEGLPYQVKTGRDETVQSSFVTYSDEQGQPLRSFWLTTASALLYRMQKAEQFNLKGVLVADVFAEGVDGSIVDALVAYLGGTTLETDA